MSVPKMPNKGILCPEIGDKKGMRQSVVVKHFCNTCG